jgi:serine/threonine protein phosphatase PrpC
VANFFEKIFGKFRKDENLKGTKPLTSSDMLTDDATKPLEPVPEMITRHSIVEGGLEPQQLIAACAQSVGKQRDHNEDALFSLTTTLANNASNLPFGLYIVADGMGGHQHGEVASEIATRAMAEYVIKHLYTPLFSVKPQPPAESLQEILTNGVNAAHEAIIESVTGGGTTLTTILVLGKQLIIGHVGDSRVYRVDMHGTMHPLTRDHSLVKRLEELGQLTPEEAAIHPQRNVLYRALGQGEPFEPEIITTPIPQPGYLLICSDGLWGVVPDEELGKIIISASTPHQACQEMVNAANDAGGPDNITAILVRLPD